jgi:hypothetical protein
MQKFQLFCVKRQAMKTILDWVCGSVHFGFYVWLCSFWIGRVAVFILDWACGSVLFWIGRVALFILDCVCGCILFGLGVWLCSCAELLK